VRQSAVTFKVHGLNFEGVVAQPDAHDGLMPGVVVCHPHPLHGGDMDSGVVLAVAFALAEQGFATLRFNFRGVGNSEGRHGKGELEQQEVLGALELMKAWPKVDARRLGVAGYSFGASVVLGSPALHRKARAFALISPPLRALESTELRTNNHSTLVIAGDRDKLVQSDQFAAALESFAQPPSCHIVAGADHFWFGHESQLAPRVAEFFSETLK
jgi:alpha/beta superfamily hydrolase